MAPLMLAFREPPKRLPASVTKVPSSRMWTRICPTSKLVPLAKSSAPPVVVKPNNNGPDATALRHARFQRLDWLAKGFGEFNRSASQVFVLAEMLTS
jgi:hypothetical protein